MAKSKSKSKSAVAAARPAARTQVRHSPIPKVANTAAAAVTAPKASAAATARPAARPVTHELIALRAFEIWSSGQGGSDVDNWLRAERELHGV